MNKYCVYKTYTIKETIDKIDDTHDRVVFVLNEEDKVIGVISQGDIIRALNCGKNLYARIENLAQPNFWYMKEKNMEEAYSIFRKRKITLMPVVDEDFKLFDVITLDDIYEYLEGKKDE